MLKSAAQTQKQINLVKLHEQSKNNLEQEIQNYKEEAQKQRKIIYQLEKERDRYINEASDLTQKVSLMTVVVVVVVVVAIVVVSGVVNIAVLVLLVICVSDDIRPIIYVQSVI